MPDRRERGRRRHQAQHQRRRTAMTTELAAAATPLQRLYVAYDYLRGAARRHPSSADPVLDEFVRRLIKAADRIYQGRNP